MSKSLLTSKSTIIQKLYQNANWNDKLMRVLVRILGKVEISEQTIVNVIKKHKTDKDILTSLASLNKKPLDLYTEKADTNRAFGKWKNIKPNLTKRMGSILDMGGNVGTTAMILGRKIFKLPKEKVLVVDIDDWEGKKWKPRTDITFVHYDDMKNIPDESIDLITIFHTLHHIPTKDYPNIIKHFSRILTSDGNIVLYEHDCSENNWAGLIDIEHALFDVIISKKKSYDAYIKSYYSKYLSVDKWEKIFAKGRLKKYHQYELHNADNSVYMYFRK